MSLLQVSVSPSQNQSLRAFSKVSPERKTELWRTREYHLVPHHKSGTGMCLEAARKLTSLSGTHVMVSGFHMGHALDASNIVYSEPACFAQFARNPFEMVVSGYLYQKASADPWLNRSFGEVAAQDSDGCEPLLLSTQRSAVCENHKLDRWRYPHGNHRSVAQVYQASRSGPIAAWLPDARTDETFPQYLSRVNLEAGLLAEFIWASDVSLAPMRYTNDFMSSRSCAVNVCFHEFYENCDATWERVFKAWEIEEPQHSTMLHAAKQSCPGTSRGAKRHSSRHLMESKRLSHPPLHEMVANLRDLDQRVLNGTLAALEQHLNCPLSGHYKKSI